MKKEERKKILLLSDDMRVFSGVGSVSRELIIGTVDTFNWVQIGGAINHPDQGKKIILDDEINKLTGCKDSSVAIYPFNGYGDPFILRQLIEMEKPDALMVFTDPRYFTWLFAVEDEIRSKIPIIYLNIWDDVPYPHYNHSYYKSCDLLYAISKQTKNVNIQVLGEENVIDLDKIREFIPKKRLVSYLPHGINNKLVYPIDENHEEYKAYNDFKYNFLDGKEYEYIVFWNNRNIRRKQPADVIYSFKEFCDLLSKEEQDKCLLIMHTQPVDENGTDLYAVVNDLCGEGKYNIKFSDKRIDPKQLNYLYNMSSIYISLSNNEGWGLGVTEALMAGKPITATVTGGMQDQMKFIDEDGKWINFSRQFGSNNIKKYEECGEWAFPLFPTSIMLQGSVQTPYIFEDKIDLKDVIETLYKTYKMDSKELSRRGQLGREWVMSEESGMNLKSMCNKFIKDTTFLLENWLPREKVNFSLVEDLLEVKNSDVQFLSVKQKAEIITKYE